MTRVDAAHDASGLRDPFGTLEPLLKPRSIAVIGASEDPARVGGMPLDYLRRCGYGGGVYAVNPNRSTVQGHRSYASVTDIADEIDLAIVALPSEPAVTAVEACASHGVRSAIVFSAGFSETGRAGVARQADMAAAAAEAGMRLCGPNCAGIVNVRERAVAAFGSHLLEDVRLIAGSIGIASQSGAVGAYLFSLLREAGLGVSTWVTTGNEADVQVADVIGYLADDSDTAVIGVYLEQIRDGARFIEAARRAHAAGKAVVAIKVGRTALGEQAALSHTAAIAGDARVTSAALRELGVVEVVGLDEFMDAARVLASKTAPVGRRVGILSISGGVGVMMADRCEDVGLEVPELPAVQRAVESRLSYASGRNPVDMTGNVANEPDHFAAFLATLMDEAGIDVIVGFLGHQTLSARTGRRFAAEAAAMAGAGRKPIWMIGMDDADRTVHASLRQAGIPVFTDPIRCVDTLARVAEADAWLEGRVGVEPVWSRRAPEALGARSAGRERRLTDWTSARSAVVDAGIPVPRERSVSSAGDARRAYAELHGAVVMKVDAPEIAHKTELGGIAFPDSEAAAADAFVRLAALGATAGGGSAGRVLVQERVAAGVEALVSAWVDPVFGPVVGVGVGGTLVEVIGELAIGLGPVDLGGAQRLVADTALEVLLRGVRGAAPVNRAALLDVVVRAGELTARDEAIALVELNPVIVTEAGAIAVDIVMERYRGGLEI